MLLSGELTTFKLHYFYNRDAFEVAATLCQKYGYKFKIKKNRCVFYILQVYMYDKDVLC